MEEPTQHPSFNSQGTLPSAGLFVPPNINRPRLYMIPHQLKAIRRAILFWALTRQAVALFWVLCKVLTPGVRANLMRLLCTPGTPLFESCGWATKLLSARDISSGMMRPGAGVYNLNAQAMDATVELIREIVEGRKVDIREVYIDTIGNPATYQQKLERIFPSLKITVAKKADSLYPCVSAASVAAKVTRDVALELCHEDIVKAQQFDDPSQATSTESWGSGYPSDSKCVGWLRRNMDPIFGWGNECRFSWGTSKEMLEMKGGVKVDWPPDDENTQLRDFLLTSSEAPKGTNQELRDWFGQKTTEVL
ncbi:hypothetical protein AFLA_002736 [Aspergillus flavus NRRL3357]|nr:hypothetical protein AFLA_002736 [Aspergillus flavus NRRL3357]